MVTAPTRTAVRAGSLRQLSPTLLWPLRGCHRLHNLEAARCFLGSSLIKIVTDFVSGGALSKGGNGRCSRGDNRRRLGPKLPQLSSPTSLEPDRLIQIHSTWKILVASNCFLCLESEILTGKSNVPSTVFLHTTHCLTYLTNASVVSWGDKGKQKAH